MGTDPTPEFFEKLQKQADRIIKILPKIDEMILKATPFFEKKDYAEVNPKQAIKAYSDLVAYRVQMEGFLVQYLGFRFPKLSVEEMLLLDCYSSLSVNDRNRMMDYAFTLRGIKNG